MSATLRRGTVAVPGMRFAQPMSSFAGNSRALITWLTFLRCLLDEGDAREDGDKEESVLSRSER